MWNRTKQCNHRLPVQNSNGNQSAFWKLQPRVVSLIPLKEQSNRSPPTVRKKSIGVRFVRNGRENNEQQADGGQVHQQTNWLLIGMQIKSTTTSLKGIYIRVYHH